MQPYIIKHFKSFSLKWLLLICALAPYLIYSSTYHFLVKPGYIFHLAKKKNQFVRIIAHTCWGEKKVLFALHVQPFDRQNYYDLSVVNRGEPPRNIGTNSQKELDIYINENGVFMRGIKVDEIRPPSLIVFNAEKQEIISVYAFSESDSRKIANQGNNIFQSEAWKNYVNSTDFISENRNQ